MPSTEENYLLLWTLISQKCDEKGNLPGIDWADVAKTLDLNKVNTAQCRWSSLKDDFRKMGFNVPEKGGQGRATKQTVNTKAKTANPKARAAVKKSKPKARAANVKQPQPEEADDDNEESFEGENIKNEVGGIKEEVEKFSAAEDNAEDDDHEF